MLTIRAMSDGIGYSSRHLEHSDYYAEGERVTGVWQGRGAELLGLSGAVKTDDFEASAARSRPRDDASFLRVRRSADRKAADGTKLLKAESLRFHDLRPEVGFDARDFGGDERLIEAHRTAVSETLQEAETYAASRVRQAGANEDRPTGNLALAVYHHDTSRELDPQLHTHAVAANLTYDGTEGRWKALQASAIYERRRIFPRFIVMPLPVRFGLWAMRSKISGTPRGEMPVSRSGASRGATREVQPAKHQRDQAIEAFLRNMGGGRRTTRSQSWYENRGLTSSSRFRPAN